jgi:hypothetical protein
LPKLVSALISQSRFFGESLAVVANGKSSRFVIAPSKAEDPKENALQCSLLGAFGGFFERSFRAHDYQLGRHNCQKFLRDHFKLASDNPIIQAGLSGMTAEERRTAIAEFDPAGSGLMPIVPLCGDAAEKIESPTAGAIERERINLILGMAVHRLQVVSGLLMTEIFGPNHRLGGFVARVAVVGIVSTFGKSRLKTYLNGALSQVPKT